MFTERVMVLSGEEKILKKHNDSSDAREKKKLEIFEYLDTDDLFKNRRKEISIPVFYGAAKPLAPKIIWLYWAQGEENAPNIVKLCIKSWKQFNPNHEIRVLDDSSLVKWVKMDESAKRHGMACFSDHVRLNLLKKYGGIWADATLFCSQPIDYFINITTQLSQFFVFSKPAPDRLISNWLIASHSDSYLLNEWSFLFEYYLDKLVLDNRASHHYYFAHYLFEYLITGNDSAEQIWKTMPQICVSSSSRLGSMARLYNTNQEDWELNDVLSERIVKHLQKFPVHKLTWKGVVRQKVKRVEQLENILETYLKNHNLN